LATGAFSGETNMALAHARLSLVIVVIWRIRVKIIRR
jgi:hypothetical protein